MALQIIQITVTVAITPKSEILGDGSRENGGYCNCHRNREHQDKIKGRIEELKGEGKGHVAGGDKPEERVDTPGGEKGSRRPDITMENPDGSKYRENVGRQNKDGSPVARERRAREDIERATGQCNFSPYCK